jgi:molybdenum cofactor cytidylyltransferase
MKFGPVPILEAEGKILAHHISGQNGVHTFHKGKPLNASDIASLRDYGKKMVLVAELEPGDVDEDTAARRLALAVCGRNLIPGKPNVGRVNLKSECLGILHVDVERLGLLNEIEGISLATLHSHAVARPRQTVATVKIIPFAVPESSVGIAEMIGAEQETLVYLTPLQPKSVALVLCGSSSARQRVIDAFESPLRTRVEALESNIASLDYMSDEEDDLGKYSLMDSINRAVEKGAELILLAGETAIMDQRDIAPRAIERLGGKVVCFGAPVDPGNLMMIAYLGEVPVLGAPGCARRLKPNVIDWVLPRLLTGEHLTRADILELGHGGLLGGLPEGVTWRNGSNDA